MKMPKQILIAEPKLPLGSRPVRLCGKWVGCDNVG